MSIDRWSNMIRDRVCSARRARCSDEQYGFVGWGDPPESDKERATPELPTQN